MSSVDESLLRKARALNEMAKRGGNEHEMANAAEKLAALLARHNLDASLLDEEADVAITYRRIDGKYNETWRRSVYASAAELFYCHYYYEEPKHKTKECTVRHVMVGEEHNLAVAAEMASYFESTINRLGNEAAKNNKDLTVEHTHRHRFIRSFRLAAAQRLRNRVYEYTQAARAGQLKVTDDSGNELRLPALQSMYERNEQLYQEWLKKMGISFGEGRVPKDQLLSRTGAALGRAAGNSISFTTQVGSGSSQHALPKE